MKGQKINDRYQIIKSIGEGGMANVYLAYDTILDRNVAVKVLRGDLASDEKFVRRFQREALAASSLSHPNIVEVYDVGEDNGQYYIVMEYIEGKHLKALLKKRGKLTTTEVVDIMLQICDGMSVAHDSYIIHRDIKPQNIMILENGLVKITDFGIAMAMNATQLTQTNSVMGSVHYLPPEQANGKGSTLKSDIYSMGILMYELLTGKLPYRGDNAVEIALKHLKEPLPSIREELPNLPQSVENIIIKATAKNPKNRYNDAREMYDDLKTCLDDSRANEPKYEFKYPEFENDDSKQTKKAMQEFTKDVKEEGSEEVIAKQITESDLKQQNKLIIILAAIFTGLVVIITSIVLLLPVITTQKEIKVPDVTNKPLSEAIRILQDEGFIIADEQKEQSSEEIAEGNVIKTNPSAGTKRTKGTEIVIYVSTGDSDGYVMENLVGTNYLTAKGMLAAYDISVMLEKIDIDEEDMEKYEDNEIIKQEPEEGTKLSPGDTVKLYIPNVIIKYPDFTDGSYTREDVEEYCEKYGVNLTVKEVITDEYADGTIIKQNREAGKYIVTEGGTLTIEVAKAPEGGDSSGEEPGLCEDGLC